MRRFALTLTLFVVCSNVTAALAAPKNEYNSTVDDQLARDRNEVRQFALLVVEMKELNMPREKFDFWQISAELQMAVEREYEQAKERWGDEKNNDQPSSSDMQTGHSLGEPNFPRITEDTRSRPRSTPAERVIRMKLIIRESNGLEQFMAMDEFDLLARYHFLMDKFLELMRDDIQQREAVVDTLSPGSGNR